MHPSTPSCFESVTAQVLGYGSGLVMIEWFVSQARDLYCPTKPGEGRHDSLWRTTCFEAFLRSPGSPAYYEFNFSPSFAWAAYRFENYRAGMQSYDQVIPPDFEISASCYSLAAQFEVPAIAVGWQLGLSAVLEDRQGGKSYWALRHPPGSPDFHHPDCFALELPPSDAP